MASLFLQTLPAAVVLRNEPLSKEAVFKGMNNKFRKVLGKCGLSNSDYFGIAHSGGASSM